jgi:hypothetical protein
MSINLLTETEFNRSPNVYVVMSADKSTVLQDSTGKPWHTTNRQYAREMAREYGGHAVKWKEALKLVLEHPKNAAQ